MSDEGPWPRAHRPSLKDMDRRATFSVAGGKPHASWEGLAPDTATAIREARLALAECAFARYAISRGDAVAWADGLGDARTESYGNGRHIICDYIMIPEALGGQNRPPVDLDDASALIAWIASHDPAHRHAGSEGVGLERSRGQMRINIGALSPVGQVLQPGRRAIIRAIRHVGMMTDVPGNIVLETGPDSLPPSATVRAILGRRALDLLGDTGRGDLAAAIAAIAEGR